MTILLKIETIIYQWMPNYINENFEIIGVKN